MQQRMMLGAATLVMALAPSMAFAQSDVVTVVSAEEIQTVVSAPVGGALCVCVVVFLRSGV